MTPADLAATHLAAFTDTRPWSESEFTDLLSQRDMILLGDPKSFILGRVIGNEAEVLTLATHPDFQRQGLGRSTLTEFLIEIRGLGVASIFLEVADTNTAAKSLYQNEGFEHVGHRPRYYVTTSGTKIGADVLRFTF
ncbi:MAG: GNAT family N-acetyltransferase [Yoonia sp.]